MTTSELARLAAMERLKAGDLTQTDVARQLGLCTRQIKRVWRAYRLGGAAALASKRRGKPSNRCTNPALLERTLSLVREHYHDFGPTFAAEKLLERHGIAIDHETLRRAMIAGELWRPKARPKRAMHPPRERRPLFGELVQIDGSHHMWFEKRAPKCTLHVAIDDATSSILALHFASKKRPKTILSSFAGTFSNTACHWHSIPINSVFSGSITPQPKRRSSPSSRAMQQLDVELISANSPQAKGRVER